MKTGTEPTLGSGSGLGDAPSLFLVSFMALFLELMVIRWVPSVIQVVAYYANLLLLSSFLGLGLGALVSQRGLRLFRLFPLALAAAVTGFVLSQRVLLPGSEVEMRFFAGAPRLLNYLVLIGIFLLNTVVFVPLGERVGELFQRLPTLRAYAWDLGGSLSGTVVFGAFSLLAFSPLVGVIAVAALFLVLGQRRDRAWSGCALLATVVLLFFSTEQLATWSPYHFITVHRSDIPDAPPVEAPPAALREMTDPPIYQVRINQSFYQYHGTLDGRRYSEGTELAKQVAALRNQFMLPYRLKPQPRRVAIIGAGGGMDVEAALLAGAESVDAVEIDPALVELSRTFNAAAVLNDRRVTVHIDDARAFFTHAPRRYDLVVFGFLDSQALSSSMANIRLDGFVYTVESFRAAYELLDDEGVLTLSFYVAGRPWLVHKLINMTAEATGKPPIAYLGAGKLFICAPRGALPSPPDVLGGYRRIVAEPQQVDLATDDWPYLYLSEQTIPRDYLIVISILLLLSLGALAWLKPPGFGLEGAHFFFLGAGFLLLQTKSVVTCSLYFGATWLVTTLVIAGILLMILAANQVAKGLGGPRLLFYLPLMVALSLPYLVPNEAILGLPAIGRAAWILVMIPLPIFFAGLIFSTTFRESKSSSASFGANLIGATIGGFAEYIGMAAGYQQLSLLVILAYLLSLLCLVARARSS